MAAPNQPLRSRTPEDADIPVVRRVPSVPPPTRERASQRVAVAPESASSTTAPARKRITFEMVFAVVVIAALYFGWRYPTQRYITPERGVGYMLGIVGGSLMLVLFLYSARKHFSWLSWLGPLVSWFRFHMVLGILGPLCILFHSNFSLGATNSNVALFCMLTVAGSGLVGRYIYSRIHFGLYGHKATLEDLRGGAESLRALSGTVSFLPELVTRLEAAEKRVLASGPHLPVLNFAKPLFVSFNALFARWRLHRYVRKALRDAARTSRPIAWQHKRLRRAANSYIDRRLVVTRRVAEFHAYERLFSLWHALHIPLIFMLVVAAIVHIVAVHVY
jgi:hypothetical protein